MNTRLLDEILDAGPKLVGGNFTTSTQQKIWWNRYDSCYQTVQYLSTSNSGITGRLISAIWDPWKNLIYTEKT